ncbi:vesicle-mediated transport protein [Malassezia pachydermatis]
MASQMKQDAGLTSSSSATSERDIPPVLAVPAAASLEMVDEEEEDEEETESSTDSDGSISGATPIPSMPDEANAWSEGVDTTSNKQSAPPPRQEDITPLEGGSVLCHIKVGELRFLCPVSREIDPLIPLAFLHKVVEVLQEYLVGSTDPTLLTEDLLCDHFDVVYQLLEEMLDGEGNVLLTEINSLKDIVLPPSWLDKLVKTVGLNSASERSRTTLASPLPWRRPNSKYAKNEVYLDLVETVDGIVQSDGTPLALDVWGRLECSAHLTGMPELVVSFNAPSMIENAAWHPCIRQRTWSEKQKLCFIPPDGTSELGTFHIRSTTSGAMGRSALAEKNKALPIAVVVELGDYTASQGGLPFEIQVEPSLAQSNTLEHVCIEWLLGDGVHGVDAAPQIQGIASKLASSSDIGTIPNMAQAAGSMVFDRKRQLLRWSIPSLSPTTMAVLQGTIMSTGPSRPSYAVQVQFSMAGYSLTGLRTSSIQLQQEDYVPNKGARTLLMGQLEFRRLLT